MDSLSNPLEWSPSCTGSIDTCVEAECLSCGVRECPHGEPLHFHHEGCPSCCFDMIPEHKLKALPMKITIPDAMFPDDDCLQTSVSDRGNLFLLETSGNAMVALDLEGVLKLVGAAAAFARSQVKP